jgi:hypothetical protein
MTSGSQGATRRLLTPLVALIATASLAAACSKGPAKSAPPKRPLSEHRALQLISKTVREYDRSPVKGGYIEVADGTNLKVDIGMGKLGVAYLTPAERKELSEALPVLKAHGRTSLFIHNGRKGDLYVKVLVLTATDYAFDEYRGTDRTVSSIAAESRLTRDVRDFVVQARARGWEIANPVAPGAASPSPATQSTDAKQPAAQQ